MKTLRILLIILLCTTPFSAVQALVLTDIENIQEKIWHLQRAVATQKNSLEEQQKQLKLIISKDNDSQLELNKRLAALTQSTSNQQDESKELENELEDLGEALDTLTEDLSQRNSLIMEQAVQIAALTTSLQTLQGELGAKQSSLEQGLAETRGQLIETRTQLDTLGQNVGGRIEQIGLWGAGTALILAIVLTIIVIGRKSRLKEYSPDRKQPPKHEM